MDFTDWTCQQLWDFIEDPSNSTLDRTSARSAWDDSCAAEYPGATPQSGGGNHTWPPPHGN